MNRQADFQRLATSIPNHFEDAAPRLGEFTAQEIATLQSRLDKQLGPEYISTRPGAGGAKVHYVAAEKVINLANEVFGFNGWSSSIQNVHVDFVAEKEGRVSLSCSIICRVTLRDGSYHEDIGCGSIENARSKAAAFEKAKKEAATDAMKRALRNFGNVLGNCLYDKDYLSKVSKVKFAPAKWDTENLHRHPTFKVKKESIADSASTDTSVQTEAAGMQIRESGQSTTSVGTDYDDEFGGNLFEEVDFTRPDEVVLHDTSMLEDSEASNLQSDARQLESEPQPQHQQPISRVQSLPSLRIGKGVHAHSNGQGKPPTHQRPAPQPQRQQLPNTLMPPPGLAESNQFQRQNQLLHQSNVVNQHQPKANSSTPENSVQAGGQIEAPHGPPALHDPPVGFIPGRAAELLQRQDNLTGNRNVPAFNPHADSPSIRRTTGVEHGATRPIKRDEISKLRVGAQVGNTVNGPQLDNAPLGPGPPGAPSFRPAVGTGPPPNFINPQADAHRKIGMPGTMQSPLSNRGGYKPPGPAAGTKRGPDGLPQQQQQHGQLSRPPLIDVSNVNMAPLVNVSGAGAGSGFDGLDAKRQRMAGS